MAAGPDVAVTAVGPATGDVGGVRMRRNDPGTPDPDPSSLPGPISRNPAIARSGSGPYVLLRNARRSFGDVDFNRRRRGGNRCAHFRLVVFGAACKKKPKGDHTYSQSRFTARDHFAKDSTSGCGSPASGIPGSSSPLAMAPGSSPACCLAIKT